MKTKNFCDRVRAAFTRLMTEKLPLMLKKIKRLPPECFRRTVRFTVSAALIMLMTALIVLQLPDAVAVDENSLGRHAVPESKNGDTSACIIYSEADSWCRTGAVRLAEKLSAAFDISVETLPDNGSTDCSAFELCVYYGFTSVCTENYLEAYLRLGSGGSEISEVTDATGTNGENDENGCVCIEILAFEEASAEDAADRFMSYFMSSNGYFGVADNLCITTADTSGYDAPVVLQSRGTAPSVMVISAPGADAHSLYAFRRLIVSDMPSLVVFDGGLDFGCSDRADISAGWKAVSEILAEYDIPWYCLFSAADDCTAAKCEMISDVIASCSGYLTADTVSGNRCVIFLGEDGLPVHTAFLFDIIDFESTASADSILPGIKEKLRVIERTYAEAGVTPGGYTAVYPGVPVESAACLSVNGTPENSWTNAVNSVFDEYLLENCSAVCEIFAGKDGLTEIYTAGNNNTGLFENTPNKSVILLSGSLDFTSYGLGGRFELNNSLRGAAVIRAGEETVGFYRYAADIGAVTRLIN